MVPLGTHLLQSPPNLTPTVPLLDTPRHFDNAVAMLDAEKADSIVALKMAQKIGHSTPYARWPFVCRAKTLSCPLDHPA